MFSSQQTSASVEQEPVNFSGFCALCLELVGGSSKKQNWKALGIAFIVIAIICSFITGAIVLTTTDQIAIQNEPLSIQEKDIHQVELPLPWNGTWISDKHFTYLASDNSIWIYNCDRLEGEVLFSKDTVQQESIDHGIVSPSAKYILIPIRKEKVRPFYTEYRYDIYEKTTIIGSITLGDDRKIPVSAVIYSHSDNLFAFIFNFNIYISDIPQKIIHEVTSDGNRDTIHNGLVEWSYEYEIFHRSNLVFWSPDDRYLAFIKINLTNLSKNHFLKYDFTWDNEDKYSIPYPKFNESLPQLTAYVYDIRTGKTIRVPRPPEYKKSYVYIHHLVWYCEHCLAVVYANRRLNSSVIQLYEIADEKITFQSRYVEETRKGPLLSRFLRPHFSSAGAYAYIIRFDQLNSAKSKQKAFPHVVRIYLGQGPPQIDAKSSKEVNADEIVHVDRLGQVYFTGSRQNNSLEKQLYRWNTTETECLSCNQSCGYASAKFSLGDGNYYILECFGPAIPYSKLYNGSAELAVINENQMFRKWVDSRLMPYIDYFSVPLDSKNTMGNGMIIFPPNYSPNRTVASYPVLVTINDRLDDQRVNKKYILPLTDFVQVTEDNIVLVIFDSHGSVGQDENYFKSNQQDWLERQYEDYLKLARHLKWNETRFNETLNGTRFGLRARGPAATIALKLLEENNEYVCAFLEAPVNELSHYHAIFSERINGLKTDIKSTRNKNANLRNKSLAIAHGTADEVVHFKHSASLVKSLTKANIPFDFKVYPDVGHDFDQDPKVHSDFLRSQRRFFQACLGGRMDKERKIVVTEEGYD